MKRALSIAVTLIILVLFARFIITFHWHDVWSILRVARWGWVILAAVANIASISAKAQGWALLMGEPARRRRTLAQAATFIGAGAGSVMVSIGGEAARVRWMVMHSAITTTTALRALVRSRITEIIMFATVILLGSPLLPRATWSRITTAAAAVLLLLAASLWLAGRKWVHIPWHGRWFGRMIAEARDALHAPGVAGALAFATVNWCAQWIAFAASAIAVAGHIPFGYPLTALIVVNIGGAFKLTPGNVGILTASFVTAAPAFGVTAPNAVSASFVLQAIEIVPVVAIAALLGAFRRTGDWKEMTRRKAAAEAQH